VRTSHSPRFHTGNTTVDGEGVVWCPTNTNVSSVDETCLTSPESPEGQSVTLVDGVESGEFPVDFDEACSWAEVWSTRREERFITELVEVLVAGAESSATTT
jgi:hypothetical protein